MNFEERWRDLKVKAEAELSARENFRHQNWRLCLDAIWEMFPGASTKIAHTWNMTPDAILHVVSDQFPDLEVSRIPKWNAQEAGAPIYEKMELFYLMFRDVNLAKGTVFFVPDYVFMDGAPIALSSESLRSSVESDQHFVFDADVLFVWPDAKAVSVFHHEGAFFHYPGR